LSNQNFVVKNGLTVGNTAVINSSGAWVGANTGLVGATGPQGATGPTGPTGATGAAAPWTRVTSNYTATSNQQIIADTSTGAFTITLPGTPATGNVVRITDGYDWSANNLTLDRNGSTIETASENLVLNLKGVTVELIYDGGTWQVTATVGGVGATGPTGPTGATGVTGATGSASPWTLSSPNIYYTTGNVSIGSAFANNTVLRVVGDWISGNSTIKVQGATANLTGIGLHNTTQQRKSFYVYDTGYAAIVTDTDTDFGISTNNNAGGFPFYIKSNNGYVGINKSSPTVPFHINAKTQIDYAGYPPLTLNNTDSGNYGLTEFTENGTHVAWLGMGGSGQTFGAYAAYDTSGLSLNHDGAGKLTISNRGTSKTIRLCTGNEGDSTFETIVVKNKFVNLPTQPRFYAVGSAGGTYTSGSYWIFPTAYTNVGSYYNTSNGRFTAPVAGTYVFFYSNISGSTSDVWRYFLYKNGSAINGTQLRQDGGATGSEYLTSASKTVMVDLAVNDYVQIYFWSDGSTASYPGTNDATNEYCTFGGYLLG
jgi:hypothetical protein